MRTMRAPLKHKGMVRKRVCIKQARFLRVKVWRAAGSHVLKKMGMDYTEVVAGMYVAERMVH
jgi:hypothetical protein